MSDAVLAGEGLAEIAQIASREAGSPVLIAVPRLDVVIAPPTDSVAPSAALGTWVTERLRGSASPAPDDVIVDEPVTFRGQPVGVIALLRGERPPRPDASHVLYVASVAVVMAMAITEARLETEEVLRGSLLDELRARRDLTAAQITQRLARFGCHVSGGVVVLCAEPREDRPRLLEALITREHPGALVQTLEPVESGGVARLFAVLPAPAGSSPESALADAQRLAEQLARHGAAGTSSFRRDPVEIGEAILEAELVLDVLRQSGANSIGESGGDLYRLLFRMFASHPEEMRSFHDLTIGPLARHDEQYRSGLIDTLTSYLESNCNMNLTAAAMFAHRHTIAHRLERINELTGLDPTLSEDRERLGLGLKVHRLVAQRPT